jgi:hypothetical protein
MSDEFPPQPTRPREIQLLVEAFASVLEGRSGTYVSSPLTSGWRAVEYRRRGNSVAPKFTTPDDFLHQVIQPNRDEAARYVRQLRQSRGGVIIDPTATAEFPGWSQSDYRVWWGEVIRRFVETVIFRDGWQYSSGCAYEFFVAKRAGLRTLNQDMALLDLEAGRDLIKNALAQIQDASASSEFLRDVHTALLDARLRVGL